VSGLGWAKGQLRKKEEAGQYFLYCPTITTARVVASIPRQIST